MQPSPVDAALAADPRDVGRLLLEMPEDQWFDRKSARVSATQLAPALIAFANAEGGVIVIGLHDGRVEGVTPTQVNHLRQAPFDATVPPVRARLATVECLTDDGAAIELAVIEVDPGERVHEARNGDCFLRVGDETRRLTFPQRQELEFDRGQAQYDGHPCDNLTVADLDQGRLLAYQRGLGATGTIERLLAARSLLTQRGALTNAACLLFGVEPQRWFPSAHIRVIRFLAVERGTGAGLNVEEGTDVRVEGTLPDQIERAAAVVGELVPRRRALGSGGRFEQTPIVPREVWLEGLVNAVIHRSYSLAGDHIRVEIYPNRLEISSPGRFPGLADPRTPMDISRFARNPRIARVCTDLRIGQELGEGIKRMFAEMRRMGLVDPVYHQGSGSVRLVLAAIPRLDPTAAARLPRGSQLVLDVLRNAGRSLSTGEIGDSLARSRPWALARLRALHDEGLIAWVGSSPKDPRAAWVLSHDESGTR